jgi:purine-binding chemotaxis protein CheW
MSGEAMLTFTLQDRRYALRLAAVARVVRAAAVTPLPEAPEIVLGVLNLQGEVLPVLSLRKRFRLPEREILSSDQFVIARAGRLTVALAVDGTGEVIAPQAEELTPPAEIVPGTNYLEAVVRCADGLVLIHDLATLLFPAEEEKLLKALERLAA